MFIGFHLCLNCVSRNLIYTNRNSVIFFRGCRPSWHLKIQHTKINQLKHIRIRIFHCKQVFVFSSGIFHCKQVFFFRYKKLIRIFKINNQLNTEEKKGMYIYMHLISLIKQLAPPQKHSNIESRNTEIRKLTKNIK